MNTSQTPDRRTALRARCRRFGLPSDQPVFRPVAQQLTSEALVRIGRLLTWPRLPRRHRGSATWPWPWVSSCSGCLSSSSSRTSHGVSTTKRGPGARHAHRVRLPTRDRTCGVAHSLAPRHGRGPGGGCNVVVDAASPTSVDPQMTRHDQHKIRPRAVPHLSLPPLLSATAVISAAIPNVPPRSHRELPSPRARSTPASTPRGAI